MIEDTSDKHGDSTPLETKGFRLVQVMLNLRGCTLKSMEPT
jgi:hypothetical protein